MTEDVTPGFILLINTGASPVFFSHFLYLLLGSSPAFIYLHNLGRMPKKLLLGFGRKATSAVVLINRFFFILTADSNFIFAPV